MAQKKLDSLGVSAFCESMSMLLKSGIQTDEAVALLRNAGGQAGLLEEGLARMQKEAENGKRFFEAMEAAGVFPEYAIRMAAAGEVAGKLDGALSQLANYYEDQKVIGDKLKNAVVYPFLILLAAIAALTVMLAMVLPVFTDVYDSLAGSLTSSSYAYIGRAYQLCLAAAAVMALFAIMVLVCFAMWQGKGRRALERILGRLPLCGPVLDALGAFRFTSALSTYLASGVTQDLAVAQSIGMVFHEPLEEKIKRCAARMEEGHGIARAAYDEKLFDPVYGRMLLVGERSGSLEDTLQKLNKLLGEQCIGQIDRLLEVVEPLLSGILILSVGISLIGAMLPLVGIMNAIG